MADGSALWPPLSEERDGETIATLHLFSQVAGKVAVALLPWRNHGWHATLHLHPRGFRTEPIHGPAGPFELDFDLVDHRFSLAWGDRRRCFNLGAVDRRQATLQSDIANMVLRA